jgi:hypothetical protein
VAIIAMTACLGLAPLSAEGQRLDIETPPSRPGPDAGGSGPATPRSRDVTKGPRFVGPLSTRTNAGRAGIAGWTAPGVPVGPSTIQGADPNGVLGLGLAVEWGRPGGHPTAAN